MATKDRRGKPMARLVPAEPSNPARHLGEVKGNPRPEGEPVDGGGHVRGHYSSIAPPISLRCLRNVKDGSATRLIKY